MIINIDEDLLLRLLPQDDLHSLVAEVPLAAGGILGISIASDSAQIYEMELATDGSLEQFSPSATNILLTDYSSLEVRWRIWANEYFVSDEDMIGKAY